MKIAVTAALVFAGALGCAPAAHAITYTTSDITTTASVPTSSSSDSLTFYQLGDQMGSSSSYDQLTVTGVSSPTLLTTTAPITLDTLTFVAGVNAYTPDTYSYSFSESITVSNGGGAQTLTIPFNLSINYADTLSIAGGNSLSFEVNDTTWDVVINALTIGPNPGGAMVDALTATVTDPVSVAPLPGALPLFASGLGAFVLIGWRRKRKTNSLHSPS